MRDTNSLASQAGAEGGARLHGRRASGRWWIGGLAVVAVLATFAYFSRETGGPGGGATLSTAPPVRVAVAEQRDMPVVERTIGTVLANTAVQVTARVQGVIVAAHFREGQPVKAGDLLFEIDPRPYKAALAQTRAQLAKDQAQLQNAVNNEKRQRAIYDQHLTSSEQLDASIAATGSATCSRRCRPGGDRDRAAEPGIHADSCADRRQDRPHPGATGQPRRREQHRAPRHAQSDATDQGVVRAAAVGAAANPGARGDRGAQRHRRPARRRRRRLHGSRRLHQQPRRRVERHHRASLHVSERGRRARTWPARRCRGRAGDDRGRDGRAARWRQRRAGWHVRLRRDSREPGHAAHRSRAVRRRQGRCDRRGSEARRPRDHRRPAARGAGRGRFHRPAARAERVEPGSGREVGRRIRRRDHEHLAPLHRLPRHDDAGDGGARDLRRRRLLHVARERAAERRLSDDPRLGEPAGRGSGDDGVGRCSTARERVLDGAGHRLDDVLERSGLDTTSRCSSGSTATSTRPRRTCRPRSRRPCAGYHARCRARRRSARRTRPTRRSCSWRSPRSRCRSRRWIVTPRRCSRGSCRR